MNARKRLLRQRQAGTAELFPLPEGKKETRNCFGTIKRWNVKTGHYDLDVEV